MYCLYQQAQGLLLWKDNQYFLKSKNSLKKEKLGSIKMKYKKKLSAVKCTLELAVTKGKSKVEACQKKIQELKHSQAQLTQRIERQDSEPDILKKELAKERKSRRYDIKTYQKV